MVPLWRKIYLAVDRKRNHLGRMELVPEGCKDAIKNHSKPTAILYYLKNRLNYRSSKVKFWKKQFSQNCNDLTQNAAMNMSVCPILSICRVLVETGLMSFQVHKIKSYEPIDSWNTKNILLLRLRKYEEALKELLEAVENDRTE